MDVSIHKPQPVVGGDGDAPLRCFIRMTAFGVVVVVVVNANDDDVKYTNDDSSTSSSTRIGSIMVEVWKDVIVGRYNVRQ